MKGMVSACLDKNLLNEDDSPKIHQSDLIKDISNA